MATTTNTTYEKVNTTFVYKNLGHETNNTVVTSPKDVTNLSTKPTSPISYDVPNRVLNLAKESITAEYLQRNLDMSKMGFNAASVGGCRVDNQAISNYTLWSSERIMAQIQAGIRNIELGMFGDRANYISDMPNIHFHIQHNLNSLNIDYTLLVQQEDGSWKNDLCDVTFIDANSMTVELSEPSQIRISLHAVDDAVQAINIIPDTPLSGSTYVESGYVQDSYVE